MLQGVGEVVRTGENGVNKGWIWKEWRFGERMSVECNYS